MACGVPVVGAQGGGLPEVVEDGVHGALRPVGDVDGMAEAALAILTDESLARRMSKACRERVERDYQQDAIVKRYRDLYEATLAG
jgi:L-malate glycosyltransferase